MLPRRLGPRLIRLTQTFPVVVLARARQVGKTTLIRDLLGSTFDIVTLDAALDVESARADPDLFLANHRGPLVIDEVQYAPELVAALKRSVDADRRPGRFVLTGSQQWSVMRSLAESLAGRAVFLDLSGFDLAERVGRGDRPGWLGTWLDDPARLIEGPLGRLPGLPPPWEILWRGQLPEATMLPLDVVPDFHAGYRRTYLERDIRLLASIEDPGLFTRFVRLVGALTAQEVNASQLGRELGIHNATARRWLDLLAGAFQHVEVPAWAGNAVKRISGRPKGYAADTGAVCSGQLISRPEVLGAHPLTGALFETAVLHEVRCQLAALAPPAALWHWRAHSGAEVDLLVERDDMLFPIEVKSTSHPTKADLRGITALREAYPDRRIGPGLILAPCAGRVRVGPTDIALPWDVEIPR